MSEEVVVKSEDGKIVYCELADYAPEKCDSECPLHDVCEVEEG
ncbi:MAG: hypothetical protein ACOC5D_07055 [Thermoplasmatota archaeon]